MCSLNAKNNEKNYRNYNKIRTENNLRYSILQNQLDLH